MEQEKKKSKLMIIIPIAIVILAVIGIIIFTSDKGTPGELKEKDVIGTWKDNKFSITLYEGGSGKINDTPLTWEIKGNTLNIIQFYAYGSSMTTGYRVEKDKITSIDKGEIYYKVNADT